MTRDDIIRMAAEAGITPWVHHQWVGGNKFVHADEGMDGDLACLMQFAALVAASERNRTWTQAHWTEYERSIVAAEREACAKVCDELVLAHPGRADLTADQCAAAIRARGENA